MNMLFNVSAADFKNSLEACEEFVEGFQPPVQQTIWSYQGRPILMKVEDLSKHTIIYYIRSQSATRGGRSNRRR